MTILLSKKGMLTAAVLSMAVTPVYAHTCNEQSALLLEIGEKYTALDYSPEHDANAGNISKSDKQKQYQDLETVKQFLAFFDNKHLKKGEGVRVNCLPANKRSDGSHIEFTLEDINRVESLNGNIQITAWEESSKKVASAVIDIPPATHWKRESNNSLSTRFLYRRTNSTVNQLDASLRPEDYLYNGVADLLINPAGNIDNLAEPEGENSPLRDFPNQRGSFISEIEIELRKSATGMTLTQVVYVNGYKAEWVTWHLDS